MSTDIDLLRLSPGSPIAGLRRRIEALKERFVGDLESAPRTQSESDQVSYVELLAEFKADHPKDFQNLMTHLSEVFELSESDLVGHEKTLYLLLQIPKAKDLDQALLAETSLARVSVKNVMKKRRWRKVDISDEDADGVLVTIRARQNETFDSMMSQIERIYAPLFEIESEHMSLQAKIHRKDALRKIHAKYELDWRENEHAMADDEMTKHFRTEAEISDAHLTTYFGSAYKGLINKRLVERLDELAKGSDRWPDFSKDVLLKIANALEPDYAPLRGRRFPLNNLFFYRNCSRAFEAFVDAHMDERTRVLTTDEEYSGMTDYMREQRVEVVKLEGYKRKAELLSLLSDKLRTGTPFDYLMFCEVSRLGTVYPLSDIDCVRRSVEPKRRPKLIVDAAQSAGRWPHDMGSCAADAVVLSTSKGAQCGTGGGVLAVTDDLRSSKFESGGSEYSLVHIASALNPTGLQSGEGEPHILEPHQAKEANALLAENFHALVGKISEQNPGRIEILRKLEDAPYAHALELKIKGVTQEKLSQLAKLWGVYIQEDHGSDDPEKIRIAFHPFMSNEALMILGYVIELSLRHTDKIDEILHPEGQVEVLRLGIN